MTTNATNDNDALEQLRVFVAAVSRLLDAIERDYKTGKVLKTAACVSAANDVQHLVTVFQSIDSPAATATRPSSSAGAG